MLQVFFGRRKRNQYISTLAPGHLHSPLGVWEFSDSLLQGLVVELAAAGDSCLERHLRACTTLLNAILRMFHSAEEYSDHFRHLPNPSKSDQPYKMCKNSLGLLCPFQPARYYFIRRYTTPPTHVNAACWQSGAPWWRYGLCTVMDQIKGSAGCSKC